MSRYLSEALNAPEPRFRQGINELERSNGHPINDIRLTSDILQALRTKLEALGLDPADTTPQELYQALNQKLKNDDHKLISQLRTLAANKVNAEANVGDGLMVMLKQLDVDKDCYVLKNSVLKKQLKAMPPKKVMKNLGYRSLDSLLKHEPLALVILAINNFESSKYVDDFYLKYKSYKATDFESHKLTILSPKSPKWKSILTNIHSTSSHQFISCYELGSLIVMPIGNQLEPGQLTASLVLMLNEIAKILSTSTYLKVHQVSSSFGQKLYQIADHEPLLSVSLMNRPIPWHLVQSALAGIRADLGMPHISSEELGTAHLIDKLVDVVPDFKFWQATEFIGLVKHAETTSLNILDVATNLSNKFSFENRHTSHFKNSLWQELISRYISPQIIMNSLKGDVQPSLALETAEV